MTVPVLVCYFDGGENRWSQVEIDELAIPNRSDLWDAIYFALYRTIDGLEEGSVACCGAQEMKTGVLHAAPEGR